MVRMVAARALATFSLLSCVTAACSLETSPTDELGAVRSAVIKGKPSDSSQDSVILLIYYDPAQSRTVGACTGTLLAPNLVLTARHCVGDTDPVAACDAKGNAIEYGVVRGDHPPKSLYVFTGKDRPNLTQKLNPAAKGAKIVDSGSKTLCNQDIALVVLDAAIEGAAISPVRLSSDVSVGELITAIGWGVTDKTAEPAQRQQRPNVKIVSVGPSSSTTVGVAPNEFEVGESICSGDSGGPAIDPDTGAVVGVVSRGGNPSTSAQDSTDPAASCIGGTNLYTKVAPFKDLIMKAYELAGAEPWLEGGPDPRKAKAGESCAAGSDCRSDLCLAAPNDPHSRSCVEDCSQTRECSVAGEKCVAEGGSMVCRDPSAGKPKYVRRQVGGCSNSGHTTTGAPLALLGALFVLSLRRKRRV